MQGENGSHSSQNVRTINTDVTSFLSKQSGDMECQIGRRLTLYTNRVPNGLHNKWDIKSGILGLGRS